MKYSKILFLAAAFTGLVSCAVNELQEFPVEKPANLAEYEYLKEYEALKNYVDRTASPDFKLGVGVTASSYVQHGQEYLLALTNFDEVTPGNAMKHASVVDKNGKMNFDAVTTFVDDAISSGMTVYGHTLAWHAQQSTKYLNSLIAPLIIPAEKPEEGGVTVGDGGYCLKLTNQSGNGSDNWSAQVWYVFEKPLEKGTTYKMSIVAKGTAEYTIGSWLKIGAEGEQVYHQPGNFAVGTEWAEVSVTFTPDVEGADRFIFNFGNMPSDAVLYVDNVTVVVDGEETNLVKNGDFEAKHVDGWNYWTPGTNYALSADGEGYMVFTGPVGVPGYCLKLTNQSGNGSDNWSAQTWYVLEKPLVAGTSYTLTMSTKGTAEYNLGSWLKYGADGEQVYHQPGNFAVGTEWAECTNTFTPEKDGVDRFILNFGNFPAGEFIYIDNVRLTVTDEEENLIKNGDFEEGNVAGWEYWTPGTNYAISAEGEGYPDIKDEEPEPGYCLNLTNQSGNGSDNWSAQTWYVLETPLKKGTTYNMSLMVKGSEAYSLGSWLKIGADGEQVYHQPGNIPVTTEWSPATLTFTPEVEGADRFILNFGNYPSDGRIQLDDIVLSEDGEDVNLVKNGDFEEGHADGWAYWTPGTNYAISQLGEGYVKPSSSGSADTVIEKTPEEKKVILSTALENWLSGMMEATAGKVKVWDAVNEPISGADRDGDGYYDLQSGAAATEDELKNNFYWQDYLGSEDYVRFVVAKTRHYYKEFGGNPEELKLFINDYNLESDWDQNKKLESLIHWIDVWESDGVTKIDGIGTQMHVSCYENPDIQKSKEDAVVKMLEMLKEQADTKGRLIKISELDMGYVNAEGKSVPTAEMTEEQHHAMADFYQFIVSKYLEIIPAAKQYGITQWCITDSPVDSGWRAGEPVGLWDGGYSRKHAYAGFAAGLEGE